MKIALVCPYDWAKPGGVRAHVANLATYLATDHQVRVIAPFSAASMSSEDRRLLAVAGRPVGLRFNRSIAPVALGPMAVRRTLAALREFDPHVVHVHEPLAPLVASTASALGPRPIVGTFHAWSDANRIYRVAAPVARRIARRLDVRLAVSSSAQDYAATALGMPLGSFKIVPNGVDNIGFGSAAPLPQLQDRDRPLLLFVGRLEPRKGLDVLIRAFLRVRSAWPAVRLCVVGDGPQRARCQEMIPPSLRPAVQFVGAVSSDELPRYHASADIFVSPAVGGESFGIVLLEAMSAGLPVIATDIPGYRTLLKDGRQGLAVPPGNAFALADAISTLLANDKLRGAMGVEGRATAAEYSWSIIGHRLVQTYRSVL